MVCWMTDEPLRPGRSSRSSTRPARPGAGQGLQYRLDVNTLHRDQDAKELGLNDIGRVQLRTTQPLFVDDYSKNRTTGRSS
jgi:bifunctional enzyme CysN/CysC